MPYYADRSLISWLAPREIHDVVATIARREDRSISNYIRRLILEDLRRRGIATEEGELRPGSGEEMKDAVGNQ